ncbi:hypothetical protein [Streptomyces tibetensis]|uniref:hypothetical protein n=1 Tax=Streptomyces tibetensis TaxID=2382123 RepID=UPI0033DDF319
MSGNGSESAESGSESADKASAVRAGSEHGIWSWPRELNSGRALSSVGGTPIAILGGFSLTNAISAAREVDGGLWRELSIIFFGVAVTFFIAALLFIIIATAYASSPSERLDWAPEARQDKQKLETLRKFQYQDEWLLDNYSFRIELATIAGIVGTLAGLTCLLIAAYDNWSTRIIAIVMAATVIFVTMAYFRWPQWLFPGPSNWPGELSEIEDEQWEVMQKD